MSHSGFVGSISRNRAGLALDDERTRQAVVNGAMRRDEERDKVEPDDSVNKHEAGSDPDRDRTAISRQRDSIQQCVAQLPGQEPHRWIRSIAPTFEVHVNDPLNHRGPFNSGDPVAMRDIVNLTYGINFGIGRRTNFTLGTVTPVTGPRPFSFETMAFLNIMYGKSSRAAATPPVLGAY